jgi:hypothetical protein
VRLFTVDLELGERTLEALTRISSSSVIQVEIGPETRAMIERLWMPKDGEGGVAGLVKKGAEALRSE